MTRGRKQILILIAVLLNVGGAVSYGLSGRSKVNAWSVERVSRIAASPAVYVTPTDGRYHRKNHYAEQTHAISLYEAKEQGLEACGICFPGQIFSGAVFPNPIERRAGRIELLPTLPWFELYWVAVLIVISTTGILFVVGVPDQRCVPNDSLKAT